MAVSRSRLDSAFIKEIRERIDVVQIIDRMQSFALATQEELSKKPDLAMNKYQLAAANALLDRRVPKLAQIEGLPDQINDNRTIINILRFGDEPGTHQESVQKITATACLPELTSRSGATAQAERRLDQPESGSLQRVQKPLSTETEI